MKMAIFAALVASYDGVPFLWGSFPPILVQAHSPPVDCKVGSQAVIAEDAIVQPAFFEPKKKIALLGKKGLLFWAKRKKQLALDK